ncbi:putative bifunctional diguanylate cyclase/phosphodiesterase [Blastococcus sp. SYSU D01042]
MAGRAGSPLLPGAPRWLLGLVALAAALSGIPTAVRILGPEGGPGVDLFVDLGLFGLLHVLLLGLLVWRARTVASERAVWSRLAVGAAVFVGCIVAAVLLHLVAATRPLAAVPLAWSPAAAFPFIYGALVRWNRHSTSVADPNDALNGASAVLAVVAVLNLVLVPDGGGFGGLTAWQLQAVFAQLAVAFVLLGTALTLPSLGGLGRDPRTWLVVGSQVLWVLAAVMVLAGGDTAAWLPGVHPLVVLCLAAAAVLRSRRSAPQPADPTAAIIGAFVVIIASTAVLVVGALTGGTAVAVWCAAVATAGAGLRMAFNVGELAQLAVTRREALTDELTGLANRRAVLRRISELSAEGTPVALALLDVDKFKEVNDALGHATGDELLRLVARRLEPSLRSGDLLGRLGGDEFAVVAVLDQDAPVEQAGLVLGERLHARLEEPFPVGGMFVHCSASIGVTTSSSAVDRPAQLLRRADVAMYDAKRAGRGVTLYDPAQHADSSGHLALVEQLRTALTADELVLHHQPQLDVADGRVAGVECLVRWAHPERGLLGPADFLPLAEVHGLMGPLTEQVLRAAVAQAADWRGRGLQLHVSVNLSASNLLDTGLPARVGALLEQHAVPASSVVLEVTESVLLTDPDRSLAVLADLAALGVTVSLDDYGTGYSSLAHLRDLPVGELKLDRSFTADLLTDRRTDAIVASTIDLSHRLGLRVVAEGVEDEPTLARLRALGCDTSQGWLHSPALPAPVLERWMLDREFSAVVGTDA